MFHMGKWVALFGKGFCLAIRPVQSSFTINMLFDI